MTEAYICDYIRTPIGRYGGALSSVRADDLGAVPLKALMERNGSVDWEAVDDVIFGSANQAGEDNRNVARMSLLLAGLPVGVSGTTINRLCGSGMDAVITAARAIKGAMVQFRPCASRIDAGARKRAAFGGNDDGRRTLYRPHALFGGTFFLNLIGHIFQA
ncbi:beta-ketoadipyl CoA thiolase [Brucella melitensis NI]|nr:beta-ketoadipyl CoA thiolase [Brucella melitensis NI]